MERDQETELLLPIKAGIAALKTLLAAEQPPGIASPRIRTGISMALTSGGDGFFGLKASAAAAEAFNGICADIHALPADLGVFISHSLWLVGTGPGRVETWTKRLPHPYVMTEVAKAFDLAVSMVLGETPADREFRLFYVLASEFKRAALKSKYGTGWDSGERPTRPVPEYEEYARGVRDRLLGQFGRLDGRHLRIMDDRLRRYRPATFHPDMAPVGHTNTPEQRQRIVESNEQARAEAKPYQTGEIGIAETMALLAEDAVTDMSKRASLVVHATNVFFSDGAPLLTFEAVTESGVEGLAVPEPDDPSFH